MTWHLRQTGYSLHFSCSYLTFILVTDCRLFPINRFCSQNTMNSLAMNSIEQWYYRSFELEGKLKKTGCCVFSAKRLKKKKTTQQIPILFFTVLPRHQETCNSTTSQQPYHPAFMPQSRSRSSSCTNRVRLVKNMHRSPCYVHCSYQVRCRLTGAPYDDYLCFR